MVLIDQLFTSFSSIRVNALFARVYWKWPLSLSIEKDDESFPEWQQRRLQMNASECTIHEVKFKYPIPPQKIPTGPNTLLKRQKRQFDNGILYDFAAASTCFTSHGILGTCVPYQQCYPFLKLSALSSNENLITHTQNSCSYTTASGEQEYGICCDDLNFTPANHYPQYPFFPPFYPQNPVPPFDHVFPPVNWPPPLPTHPPEHETAPTHSSAANTKPTVSYWPPTQTTRPTFPPGPDKPPPPTPIWPPGAKPTTKPPYKPPTMTTVTTTKPQWPFIPSKPTVVTTKPTLKPITKPPWMTKPPSSTKPPTYPTLVPDAEDLPLNFSECGIKNGYQDQERIVGGHNADPGEWPWMVAILTNGRLFCGGSLIDNIHILTAAHCVAHMNPWDVARLRINLGDYNIKSKGDVQHVERKVKQVVRHRGFDSHTLYNDIAILTLDSPVTFSKNVRPICLPAGKTAYSGRMGTVIGWGSLREMGPTPGILQEVNIPIWTNSECKSKYGPAAPGGIVDSFLCAGKASKDSCSGDSGGPLMINDGKWHQIGIVSWGIGCGKGQYPGVYTRVTSFMPWIRRNIDI
ncbi:hypothetical protein PGB90_004579 [Kerria lacca]